jgi:multidrug efflux pump subunit AcrB
MRLFALLMLFVLLLAAVRADEVPSQARDKSQPMMVVKVDYPGANAMVVQASVAAPIEQQVKGVPNLLHMASRCGNDGSYTLAVTFKPGTDVDRALVLVRKRVALAQPILPDVVKNSGVTVRKQGPVRMIVSLTSPTGKHDSLYLSNYATICLRDELTRIAGVGAVDTFGQRHYSIRVWLDPQKLAVRNLSAKDVIDAMREQKVPVPAGRLGMPPTPLGQQFQLPIATLGRLSDPAEFADIIVKASSTGDKAPAPTAPIVRLKDVARTELGAANTVSYVSVNGRPGVVLGVYPTGATSPKKLSRALADKIAGLRPRLPEGLRLEVSFDFTPNLERPEVPRTAEYLLLDLDLPASAGMERREEAMVVCEKLLRNTAGVQDVLAMSENPFDLIVRNEPCFLVQLTPPDQRKMSRQEITQIIRAKLGQVPSAVLRLRDLSRLGSFPRCGYPIAMAVTWPADHGADKGHELAQKFAERLQKSRKVTDASANQESSPRPYLHLDIDRTRAMALGVVAKDIFATLEIYLGSMYVNDYNRFGRTWQVVVQPDEAFRNRADGFKLLQVRNDRGQMVQLGTLVTMKTVNGPGVIHSLDFRPMVAVTANPTEGVSLAAARKLCETAFAEVRRELRLPAEYRLIWLHDMPASK